MMAAGRSVGTRIIAIASLAAGLALAGCANGDFDRVKPGLVTDDIHNWVGTTAALGNGAPVSDYPLTDDERLLRDLAYPLIEPPYDRQRWFSILNEYGIDRIFHHDWSRFDEQAYMRALMNTVFRSESGRYARLGDDIRNDRTRVPGFFEVAGRVLDMDRKREKNLAMVSYLTEREQFNAVARNGENALVISWVQWSLVARAVSYRVALERLSISAPMPAATDLDRAGEPDRSPPAASRARCCARAGRRHDAAVPGTGARSTREAVVGSRQRHARAGACDRGSETRSAKSGRAT